MISMLPLATMYNFPKNVKNRGVAYLLSFAVSPAKVSLRCTSVAALESCRASVAALPFRGGGPSVPDRSLFGRVTEVFVRLKICYKANV